MKKCVAERASITADRTRPIVVWHIAMPYSKDSVPGDFMRIACSESDGIVFNGPLEEREPTCPACKDLSR